MSIYLDNAATTALAPEALEAMTECMKTCFGNPSSTHSYGRAAKAILEQARKQVAALLGALPAEIYFTAGGTEADNLAIRGMVAAGGITHIITSPLEHHAVSHTVEDLQRAGAVTVSYLKPNAHGDISLQELEALLQEHPHALVTLMHANNEIGNLLDLQAVGALCEQYGALFHTDTVQTVGHQSLDLKTLKVHALVGSAHKFHGPKGVGFLYLRKGTKIHAEITGGGQEKELRSGTENIAGIVGMAKALELSVRDMEEHRQHITSLKVRLMEGLQALMPEVRFNGRSGELEASSYTVLNVSFPPSEKSGMLLFFLDLAGIAVSGGSACSSGAQVGSHVLSVIGAEAGRDNVRFSFGKYNTAEEVDSALATLAEMLVSKAVDA